MDETSKSAPKALEGLETPYTKTEDGLESFAAFVKDTLDIELTPYQIEIFRIVEKGEIPRFEYRPHK